MGSAGATLMTGADPVVGIGADIGAVDKAAGCGGDGSGTDGVGSAVGEPVGNFEPRRSR